jgi:hypothetical protein
MNVDLAAGSDLGVVLFDEQSREAVLAATGLELEAWPGVLQPRLAAAVGEGLVFGTGCTGEDRLRLYVDEAPGADLRLQLERSAVDEPGEKGRLQLPSGRLCVCGTGELARLPAALTVPPGSYRVEASRLDWDPGVIDDAVRARLDPADRDTDQLYGPLLGALVALTILVALIGLLVLVEELLRGGPAAFLRALKVWAAAVAVGGTLSALGISLTNRSGTFRRVDRVRDEVHREHPTLVVVLSREG